MIFNLINIFIKTYFEIAYFDARHKFNTYL